MKPITINTHIDCSNNSKYSVRYILKATSRRLESVLLVHFLLDLWEHTITEIFKHDAKSELGIMIRQWVIHNKLEDFNSWLNYTDEDLIPRGHGSLRFYKENGDSVVITMSPTPLAELINIRWYIQHLIHESGYLYDDDESNYPLSEDKWMIQTHGKFMKYVFYT